LSRRIEATAGAVVSTVTRNGTETGLEEPALVAVAVKVCVPPARVVAE
jgi:hypothetical protein